MKDPIPIRFHHLKAAGRSAAHARMVMSGEEDRRSYSLERGDALHALVFGTRKVTCYPGKVRRGREWEAFRAAHAEDDVLTGSDYDRAQRMAEAVTRREDAMELLTRAPIHGRHAREWSTAALLSLHPPPLPRRLPLRLPRAR